MSGSENTAFVLLREAISLRNIFIKLMMFIREYGFTILLVCSAFAAGLAYMYFYYWQRFNGDSAIAYVVAEQINAEGRLWPVHFNFSNDIFFLRPQFAIAIFQRLGMTGYPAYATGCAAMFAFAVGCLFRALVPAEGSVWTKAFWVLIFFVPLGYNDIEFILGQQSHLLQTTFAICLVLLVVSSAASSTLKFGRLATITLLAAMLVADSPLRGIMSVTITCVIALYALPPSKYLKRACVAVGVGLVLGLLVYSMISRNLSVMGISYYLVSVGSGDYVDRLGMIASEFISAQGGISYFQGLDLKPPVVIASVSQGFIVFGILTLLVVLVWELVSIGWRRHGATAFFGQGELDMARAQSITVGMVGAALALVSLFLVLNTKLDPISRHILPGIELVKFCGVGLVLYLIRSGANRARFLGFGIIAMIFASSPVISVLLSGDVRENEAKERAKLYILLNGLKALPEISEPKSGRLLGDHWNVYRFAVLTDTELKPLPIGTWPGELIASNWLSVQNRICETNLGTNVFILGPGDDSIAEQIALTPDRAHQVGQYRIVDLPGFSLSECADNDASD